MFPKATLERLKLYHRLLSEEKEEYISSEEIGGRLGIPPEQVRKDLSYLEYKGKPKVGYHVKSLLDELNRLFGLDKKVKVIIVGAGNLGTALTNYPGFSNYNIEIVGIFDKDPERKKRVKEVLKDHLKDRKITLLMVSHQEEEEREIADRIFNLA